MTTSLITGGNKGLGYEAARRLLAAGHEVWIGARDTGRGEQAASELGARFVQLDVTSDESVDAAAQTVGDLDVLVNNAGILNPGDQSQVIDLGSLREILETNVVGAVRVFQAFAPALQRSAAGTVVNVSSGLGSMSTMLERGGPSPYGPYSVSKAALNMLTVQWSQSYPSLRVNAVNPGYTATDLNGNSGHQTVTEGTDAMVQMATIGADGPTGTLISREGPEGW